MSNWWENDPIIEDQSWFQSDPVIQEDSTFSHEAIRQEVRQRFAEQDRRTAEDLEPLTEQTLGQQLADEIEMIRRAREQSGIGTKDYIVERLPFIGSIDPIERNTRAARASERIRSGEYTSQDVHDLAAYMATQDEQSERGFWGKVIDQASRIPKYGVEFGLTGGAFAGGSRAVGGRLGAALFGSGMKAGTAKALSSVPGAAAGVAAQTAVNPQLIAEQASRRMVHEFGLGKDEQGELQAAITSEADDFPEAMAKGFGDALIEIGSERTGWMLTKPLGKMATKLGIARRWFAKNPGARPSDFRRMLQRMGWHGVIGEVFEERVGDVARGATGVEDHYGTTGGLVSSDPQARRNALEQLAVESISFGLYGGGMGAAGSVAEMSQRQQPPRVDPGRQVNQEVIRQAREQAAQPQAPPRMQPQERVATERHPDARQLPSLGGVEFEGTDTLSETPESLYQPSEEDIDVPPEMIDRLFEAGYRPEDLDQMSPEHLVEAINDLEQAGAPRQAAPEAAPPRDVGAGKVTDKLSEGSNEDLAARAAAGDREAMGQLVQQNQGLVASFARQYAHQEADLDDYLQEGSIALMEAAADYDPSQGAKFSTRAAQKIRGRLQWEANKRRREAQMPERGIEPQADPGQSPAEQSEAADEQRRLQEVMGELDERDREIITAAFSGEQTQREIAQRHGISPTRVGQIVKRAKERMRGLLEGGERGGGRRAESREPEAERLPEPAQRKFSSTQIDLPEDVSKRVKAAGKKIAEEDLAEDGREEEPHITVKYGLHTEDADEVRRVVESEPPIRARLGKVSIFPAAEASAQRGGAQYDVVKADVESEDLHRLNQKIADAVEHTDTHPEYKPHVTLAYVHPGQGKKYEGMDDLEGAEVALDKIVFSGKSGQKVEIPLKGKRRVGTKPQAEIRPGKVGDQLSAGQVVTTRTGRQTTPFPNVDVSTGRRAKNTVKRADHWLWENAVEEARSRGDDFNLRQFESEDPGKLPPASKDAMEEYLFGDAAERPAAPAKEAEEDPAERRKRLFEKEQAERRQLEEEQKRRFEERQKKRLGREITPEKVLDEFDKLDKEQGGYNLVTIEDLVDATGGDIAKTHEAIRELEREGKITLGEYQSRYIPEGGLSERRLATQIQGPGGPLDYVSRRTQDFPEEQQEEAQIDPDEMKKRQQEQEDFDAEMFEAFQTETASDKVAEPSSTQRVLDAADKLSEGRGGVVKLADLRRELQDLPRERQDQMILESGLPLESLERGLTPADVNEALETPEGKRHAVRAQAAPEADVQRLAETAERAAAEMEGEHPGGMVPIWKVRQKVRAESPDAPHSAFDKAVKSLRDRGWRLAPISNTADATGEQLFHSVPGIHETLFYLKREGRAEPASAKLSEESLAEQAKAKMESAEKKTRQVRRKSAAERGREARYWKESRKRAQKIKGKRQTVEIKGKDGPTKVKAEVVGSFAIHKAIGEDASGHTLTHLPTGFVAASAKTALDLKQFMQVADELGHNLNEAVKESGDIDSETASALRRVTAAWDTEDFRGLKESEQEALLESVQVAPTSVKADIVLDSFSLGQHDDSRMSKKGLDAVKQMAKEVPEFAFDPVFTVNKNKQLVYRDGATYTFNPEGFNLDGSDLSEGQTVGINLEDIGLKQLSGQEAVAKTLKNVGFANVRQGKGGDVKASWKGKKVRLVGEADQWEVDRAHGPADASQAAHDTLKKMGFLKGDAAPPAKKPPKEPPQKPSDKLSVKGGQAKGSEQAMSLPASPTQQNVSQTPRRPGDESGEIAAADILKTWERIFKVPMRAGGFSRRAAGIYKTLPEVVRVRESYLGNLAVAAHEIAHHIDKKAGLIKPNGGSDVIPADALNEVRALDYEPKGRSWEGFAEFVRHYITEQDARILSPKFHDWFEGEWMAQHPEWAGPIREARRHARQFADQTVFQRLKSAIGHHPGRDLSWSEQFKKDMSRRTARFATKYFNRFFAAEKAQEEGRARGYQGVGPADAAMFYSMTEDANAGMALRRGVHDIATGQRIGETTIEGLKDHLNNDAEYDEAVAYAYARHTLFMRDKSPVYNTGITPSQAESWIRYVEQDPDKAQRYEAFAKDLAEFNNDLLEMLVRAGAMAPDQKRRMIEFYGDNYFPLHRAQESGQGFFSGAGFANLPPAVFGRSREGSGRRVIDPVDATIARAIHFYGRAGQARVGLAFANMFDPSRGGVEGMGGLMDRVDPKRVVHEGRVSEILDTLVAEEILDEDDARAMKIAAQIREGEPVSARNLAWFAERHGIAADAAADEMLQAAEREPDALATIALWRADYTPNAKKRQIVIYDEQGNPMLYEVDPLIYEMAIGMTKMEVDGLTRLARPASRFFKTFAVGVNPAFVVANIGRDYAEYQGKARATGAVEALIKPWARLIGYAAHQMGRRQGDKQALYDLYTEMAGKIFTEIGPDIASRRRTRRRLTGKTTLSRWGLTINEKGELIGHAKDAAVGAVDSVKDAFSVSDAPPRLAEMEAVIRERGYEPRGDKWLHADSGQMVDFLPEDVRIAGMLAASEATVNFKRFGTSYPYVEAWLPFANATIQASFRQWQQIKSLRRLGEKSPAGDQGKRYLVYLSALVAAELLHWLWRHDDDDYREQRGGDAWLKEQYWTWGWDGKTYLRIPKPRNDAVVGNTAAYLVDRAWHEDGAEVEDMLLRDIFNRTPLGGGASKSALELTADFDFFRWRDITPPHSEDTPPEQIMTPYTSEASRAIGQVTGKSIGMSPVQVEHFLDESSGGFYGRVSRAWDAAAEGRLGVEHIPALKALALNRHQAGSIDEFYEAAKKAAWDLKRAEAAGESDEDLAVRRKILGKYESLMAGVRRLDKRDPKGRRKFLYEPYIVGLARSALGRPPLEHNPDPFYDRDAPEPIREMARKRAEDEAKVAILSYERPRKRSEPKFDLGKESKIDHQADMKEWERLNANYPERLKKWRVEQKAAEQWLRGRLDSPVVAKAVEKIKRSKAFEDLMSGRSRPEFDVGQESWGSHLEDMEIWNDKVRQASQASQW